MSCQKEEITEISIFRLAQEDWAGFWKCFQRVLATEFSQYSDRQKARILNERKWKKSAENGQRVIWVAKAGGKITGFLVAKHRPAVDCLTDEGSQPEIGKSWINWLGVLPAWQGRKVGSKLVLTWLDWAKKQGYRELVTATTKQTNGRFFHRFGFRPVGEKINHWGLKEWRFRLEL